jgi:hypothetical protein
MMQKKFEGSRVLKNVTAQKNGITFLSVTPPYSSESLEASVNTLQTVRKMLVKMPKDLKRALTPDQLEPTLTRQVEAGYAQNFKAVLGSVKQASP